MILKGSIFVKLRNKMLDFFPERCKLLTKNRMPFNEWLLNGIYLPLSVTKNRIIIETSPQEIGSIFLSDIEFFINHCYEHFQEMICYSKDDRIRSDAWNAVNIYYYGFFVAHSLLRILGEPVVYISKESLKVIKEILNSTNNPGAGTYQVKKIRDITETKSEYLLKKSGRRMHEATWNNIFTLLESSIGNGSSQIDQKELLFYKAITTKKLFRGYQNYEWPSLIRNRTNYVPGYAYQLIENKIICKTKQLIGRWCDCNYDGILRLLESSISACIADLNEISSHTLLMHEIFQSLFLLIRELYLELIHRRNLDRRMEVKRKQFLKKMEFGGNEKYHCMIGKIN
jgi:hypothetical protein